MNQGLKSFQCFPQKRKRIREEQTDKHLNKAEERRVGPDNLLRCFLTRTLLWFYTDFRGGNKNCVMRQILCWKMRRKTCFFWQTDTTYVIYVVGCNYWWFRTLCCFSFSRCNWQKPKGIQKTSQSSQVYKRTLSLDMQEWIINHVNDTRFITGLFQYKNH